MQIFLSETAFDPWQLLHQHQQKTSELAGRYGATAVFVGTMRDFNIGDPVTAMTLEHYPGMTEKRLHDLANEAAQRWQMLDGLLVHRIGTIQPNDTIVLVAVWSAHRGDAFDACRHLMETLKSSAPFWKKETLADGQTRWVDSNTDGYHNQPR